MYAHEGNGFWGRFLNGRDGEKGALYKLDENTSPHYRTKAKNGGKRTCCQGKTPVFVQQ